LVTRHCVPHLAFWARSFSTAENICAQKAA
jgi:hypothetical protein